MVYIIRMIGLLTVAVVLYCTYVTMEYKQQPKDVAFPFEPSIIIVEELSPMRAENE
jgi:hypothetical protein